MSKGTTFGSIAKESDTPLATNSEEKVKPTRKRTENVPGVPGTVSGAPSKRWEERFVRRTFHVDRELLEAAKQRAKNEGGSFSSVVNTALRLYLNK